MPLKPNDFFTFMRNAYSAGLMRKMEDISQEAIRAEMDELGVGPYEAIDQFDQSDPSIIEARLGRVAPLLRLVSRPSIMRALARLLDVPAVRKRVIAKQRKNFKANFQNINARE